MRDSYGLYMDRLKGIYKETFEKISLYVTAQNFDEDTVETQMSELLDMFLLAQEEEKPVEKIVGDDLELFCKEFCTQFGWKNKLLNIADRWKSISWIFFIIGGIDMAVLLIDLISGEPVDFWSGESAFNFSGYLFGLLIVLGIATIVNLLTIRLMFRFKKGPFFMKIVNVIHVLTMILSFLIVFSILQSGTLKLFELPSWILCVLGGVYLIVYYTLNKERIQERRANKVSVFGVIREDIELNIDAEFHKEMQKTYQKKCAKLLKRGKPELTWEDFLTLQEKDVQKAYRLKPLYDWLPWVVTILLGISEYLNNGFGIDLVIYVVVLLIVEVLFLKGIWKIVKGALDTKMSWVQTERKRLDSNGM